MNITACKADNGGCGFYRIMLPYFVVGQHGHKVHVAGELQYNQFTMAPRIPADVIVVQRPGNKAGLGLFEMRRRHGMPIVAEIDDLLWGIPRSNPAWEIWHTRKGTRQLYVPDGALKTIAMPDGKALVYDTRAPSGEKESENLFALREFLAKADAITVSTAPLAEECRRIWPTKPVYVLPNCTASGDWPEIDRQARNTETGTVTIGWGGSWTHKADLALISGLPGQVMAQYPQTRLHLFGGYHEAVNTLAKGIEPSRVSEVGWQGEPWKTMPGLVEPIDIGLAPVEDNRFNHCKSDLKALEYGLASIPTIASDTPTYRSFIRHGENGFLCKTPADWIKAMEILITQPERRWEMGKQARKDAEARDIDNYWGLWQQALAETVARSQKSATLRP